MLRNLRIMVLVVAMVVLMGSLAFSATYTAGTSAGFPPFEYIEDGEIVGFDIDLAHAIGELMGFTVEFIDISFDGLIPALNAGTIDMAVAGMTITEERAKVVDFSIPYFSANQSVLVKEGSGKDVTVLYGNTRLGVQTGTTGDLWVEENLADVHTGQVTHYDTFVLAVRDLMLGRIDAVVLDDAVAQRYAKVEDVEVAAILITGEEYGIAVKKGNDELLAKINEGIRKARELGIMDDLLAKYFD